ncbi:uncharacterized protein LY79DRAFT_572996 [Colletotrichum navitas]|uniref:Uncharacterized protein n=1 Tax=Colletotrichum navitas TaxID=681940 RepID=A0AAD8PJN6_9PEZI|nr:uncharacterized protein LY79DRAFT_572996 [Colletotrichum navitas]KAK1565978.1 hypothetical protein LY79DRAFT_572996 [Colletotrichum navitas]
MSYFLLLYYCSICILGRFSPLVLILIVEPNSASKERGMAQLSARRMCSFIRRIDELSFVFLLLPSHRLAHLTLLCATYLPRTHSRAAVRRGPMGCFSFDKGIFPVSAQ